MILFTAFSLFAGCTQTALPDKQPLVFSGTPIVLNVSNITISEEYQTSKHAPNVEGYSDITPADAVKRWVAERLVAGSKTDRAEVIIKDAHIIRKNLPKEKTGLEGYFSNEVTEEYDGRLEVEIRIYSDKRPLSVANVNAISQSTRTLLENATIVDRENLYHDMSIELMKLLEKELDKNIHANFSNYLLYN